MLFMTLPFQTALLRLLALPFFFPLLSGSKHCHTILFFPASNAFRHVRVRIQTEAVMLSFSHLLRRGLRLKFRGIDLDERFLGGG